ncbi:MAG: hypothetical protein ACXADW_24465 [Candidatus Hodarchaeales archaeon]|jgi:hypothetical protein
MTNNKKKKKTKVKKEIVYRTKKERQEEVKNILKQLSEFDLDIKYDPIKKLYQQFKTYIAEGNRILINIPFPEINRRIKGLLAISVNEEVWIKLEREKF